MSISSNRNRDYRLLPLTRNYLLVLWRHNAWRSINQLYEAWLHLPHSCCACVSVRTQHGSHSNIFTGIKRRAVGRSFYAQRRTVGRLFYAQRRAVGRSFYAQRRAILTLRDAGARKQRIDRTIRLHRMLSPAVWARADALICSKDARVWRVEGRVALYRRAGNTRRITRH